MEKFLALNDGIVFAFDLAQLIDTVLEDFYFLKQSLLVKKAAFKRYEITYLQGLLQVFLHTYSSYI